MEPLVHAVGLSYHSSPGPEFIASAANETIPPEHGDGGVWERLYELEADSPRGGVHARVFVDHPGRRAIVAFRGICMDDAYRQCQVDKCFLQSFSAFGVISNSAYNTNGNCTDFAAELDYVATADRLVRNVQAKLAGYSILLTGHSLGGALAIVSAAQQPGVLQAVTFAPTAFHALLAQYLGMSESDIARLPAQDLIATGDPYDCLINSVYVHPARAGSTTCLYEGTQEPPPCDPRMKESLAFDMRMLPKTIACKGLAHLWPRYVDVVLERREDGVAPRNLPTCSTGYSSYHEAGAEKVPVERA